MSDLIKCKVKDFGEAPRYITAAHPKVTHLATLAELPVEDPRTLGGQVVEVLGNPYQVLGVQQSTRTPGKWRMALRRLIKVGRG